MLALDVTMTIEELGSIGELIAAITTVVTLAYLAIQIRRNTLATHSASFHAISDSMNHINVAVAQNADLSRIWLSGLVDRVALSEAERHQFDMLLLSYFHVFETMHYQASKGAGDEGLMGAEERSLAALFNSKGVRDWWSDNPYAFGDEFRQYLEQFESTIEEVDV
jgi:hypothetical protein